MSGWFIGETMDPSFHQLEDADLEEEKGEEE